MAHFAIKMPSAFMAVLKANTEEIMEKRRTNEYASYPEFVNNLMSGMDTPAEELHHATTGMAGEAGECLDISKKVWVYNKELDVEHLVEELGDVRFYYQATLNMLGLSDADIQTANTVKLRKRFPDGVFNATHAIAQADKVKVIPPRKFMGMPAPAQASEGANSANDVEPTAPLPPPEPSSGVPASSINKD